VLQRAADGATVQLGERRLIINPGSTGQPRDGDPRASYALYDSAAATVTWHRVEYDVAATQRKMRDARLDAWLIERLAVGR
jgi:diadenosine tetraphosphatase ApaH/serine/threonine PP2A family protein phosphatase